MKKLYLISLLVILLLCVGCTDNKLQIKDTKFDVKSTDGQLYKYEGYRLVVIDGCEYILMDRGITHKGNCINKIHLYKSPQLEK